jgi:ATP/maltotriose-dependent transcriptional regulator MalT/DNA-binding SARP family transcriptional activator
MPAQPLRANMITAHPKRVALVTKLAKLARPKLHQVLPRERLFARLNECRTRSLVWVMGPPGAGKTSLVASYLDAIRATGVWYQVDPGDRDLETFFHYLSRAVIADAGKRSVVLPKFSAEHRSDPIAFARLFFRALFECMRPPAVLVLDNYHELPGDAELHKLLDAIVREAPEGHTVIVTSRTEPPAECASLRLQDRLAILDWDELRLTLDETRRIAASRQVVDETKVREIHQHTDGWPVGLAMTLEQIKRGIDGIAGQGTKNREVLFNYFAGQIVAALPETEREQLMRIALLSRSTAAQAAAIGHHAGAGALLESLYRKRLFVEKRADAFQFHDLFRAFLLSEFDRTHDAATAARLRSEAAALLAADDQVEEAFVLATAAQDWDYATSLVLRFAPRLLEQGRLATLRDWFDAMPMELVEESAWLGFWLGVSQASLSPLQARPQFERSYHLFPGEDRIGRILCCAAILRMHYLEFDHGAVEHWLDELLPLLDGAPSFPAPAAELRVHSSLLFALSYQRPRRELVAACLARIHELLPATGVPSNARIDAATMMLAHYQATAEFDDAERVVALAEPWLSDPILAPTYRSLWTLHMAHFRVKQGRDAEAERLYEQAQEIIRENALGIAHVRVYTHVGRATIALCAGDAERAEAERVLAASQWTYARRLDLAIDSGLRSSVATQRGEYAEAVTYARQQLVQLDEVGPLWLRCCGRLQQALVELDAGTTENVSGLLQEARHLLTETCFGRLGHAVDCVEAYARILANGAEAARPLIERCVAGSQAHCGQYFLRMHPRVMPTVFASALALGIETGDAKRAIREFALRPPSPDPPGWPWPLEVRMLGPFEVLRNGKPLEFSRKLPRKTLALMKAVVALGGRSVSEQRLIDALWPEEEGDAAARALDATVLRLRALLGDPSAVMQRGGQISLDLDRVWIDLLAFEQALASAEVASRTNDAGESRYLERALTLYRGAFLAGDESESWPVTAREKARSRFVHALARLAQIRESRGEDEAAVDVYLRGLDVDPMVESFYQGLMRCYHRLGRRSEAISAYHRLKQILSITLGLAPSQASEKLYESLRLE